MNLRSTLGLSSIANGTRDTSDSAGDGSGVDLGPYESILGTEYDIDPLEEIFEGNELTKIKIPAPEEEEQETEMVAGPALMDAIEQAYEDADDEELIVPIGYQATDREIEIVGFPLSEMFEHTSITGTTGSAKTTTMIAVMVTMAYADIGFFGSFPKGSEDSLYLVRCLPEPALDKLVVIDPTETQYTIPQNLFDVPEFDDPDARNEEINKRLDVLLAILTQDWGDGYINVETVIEVAGRAFMQSDEDYCLLDMFFFVVSTERQEQFAESVDDPFLADAAREIAEMDEDTIRPVTKRLMSWVLDPTIRRMISHRKTKLDWREVIEDDKIVLLRLGTSNKAMKSKLMLSNWREITAAIEQRYNETGVQYAYGAFLDEFDAVASDKLDFADNLARMRARGLAITILCQYPGQLPNQGRNSTFEAFKANINNTVALKMKDKDNARVLTDKLEGVEPSDLVHLPKYQCWTDVPVGEGQRTNALNLNTFPPMAPLRSEEEAEAVLNDRLKEVGEEPPTLREMVEESPFDIDSEELLMIEGEDGETIELDGSLRPAACKAVYDQSLREHGEGTEWVALDQTADRIRRYLPGENPFSNEVKLWNGLIAQLPESFIDREERDGDMYLRCTDQGYRDFITPEYDPDDDEDDINNNQGGAVHNRMIEQAYDDLTLTGGVMSGVLGQTGEAMPDALLTLDDIDLLGTSPGSNPRGKTPRMGSREQWKQFEEEYPLPDRLTGGQDAAIESECTTADTKFAQTLVNLAAAVNNGQRCLFLAQEDTAPGIWRKLTEEPRYCRDDYPKPGRHRLYNMSKPLRIGGNIMYRPAGPEETVWLRDDRPDQPDYRVLDSDGNELATFETAAAIFEQPDRYPAVQDQVEDYDDWVPIKQPAVPAALFDGEELPGTDVWDILVVTEDGVFLYDDGTLVPLDELLEYEDAAADADLDLEGVLGGL